MLSRSTALPSTPKLLSNIIAQEGDSRTNHGALVTGSGVAKYNDGLGFWLEFLSKGRVNCPSALNFGVSGNTSTQILARLPASIATAKAAGASAMMLFGCSTNDRGTIALGAVGTAGTTLDNYAQMQALVRGAGLALIWVAEMPRGQSGSFNLSTAALQEMMAAEAWIAAQANVRGVYVARPWVQFADVSSLANAQAGYLAPALTYDNLHPNALGCYRAVRYSGLLDIVNGLFPPGAVLAPGASDTFSATYPQGVINPNPMLIGSGGTAGTGVTGAVPSGWTLRNTPGTSSTAAIASSLITLPDGTPALQFVLSGTSGSTQDLLQLLLDIPAGTNGNVAGTNVKASARVQVAAGQTGLNDIHLTASTNNGGGLVETIQAGVAHRSTDAFTTDALDGVITTDAFALPSGLTNTRLWVKVPLLLSAALSATITVSQVALRAA